MGSFQCYCNIMSHQGTGATSLMSPDTPRSILACAGFERGSCCTLFSAFDRVDFSFRPNLFQYFWERSCFGLAWISARSHQKPSLPLLSWTGERKYGERLEGRDKDRGRSLTDYYHGQNRLNLGRKGSLIRHQSNQSRIVRNKTRS